MAILPLGQRDERGPGISTADYRQNGGAAATEKRMPIRSQRMEMFREGGQYAPVVVPWLVRRNPQTRPDGAPSARCLLHQRRDPCLVGGGQLREREGSRPHGAVVEVRRLVEAQR